MSAKDCKALNFLLSLLYKTAALAGLVTIVTTLDVRLSIMVIIGAFLLYYVSREIIARLCPYQKSEEHQQITRFLHRSDSGLPQSEPITVKEIKYGDNITPFRHPDAKVGSDSDSIQRVQRKA